MRRGFAKVSDLALTNRHKSLKELALPFNLFLRGHYAYYGLGGNQASLHKIRRHTEKCWHRALNKRCWKGKLDWDKFQKIKMSASPTASATAKRLESGPPYPAASG